MNKGTVLLGVIVQIGASLVLNGFNDPPGGWPAYSFANGGRDWPGICTTGRVQSPIDLTEFPSNPSKYQVVTALNSTFRPIRVALSPVLKSNTLTMDFPNFVSVEIFDSHIVQSIDDSDIVETFSSFRFLVPAPHTVNGLRYPMAIHIPFVIQQPDGILYQSTNMNINFREGRASPLMEDFFGESEIWNLASLFPSSGVIDDYYYYIGSTYTPFQECLEPKAWVIPSYVLEASSEQIKYWQDRYINDFSFSNGRGNIRPLQPLGERVIYHYVPQ